MRWSLFFCIFMLTLCPKAQAQTELLVSAAASLTDAFQDMKPAFEKLHPEITLVLNFASSGALLKQIQQGAPVDVFASADQHTMDKAMPEMLPDSRQDFAANALTLIVPMDNPQKIMHVQELKAPQVTVVAIGNPESVPAGRYAKEALETAQIYDILQEKLILAENVRQALDYVSRGEAPAGIVFATDARARSKKVKTVQILSGHTPITYPLAVRKLSSKHSEAQKFIAFVISKQGQEILAERGFHSPPRP